MNNKFDIIVVGAGHAGIEASYIAAKMGCSTALITMNLRTIGAPSCNPSIGGTAKGHLVKEIDALGGAMAFIADLAGIHFKMLNRSKGPAVWSPRCQIDKNLYPKIALNVLRETKNLFLIEDTVIDIIQEKGKAKGVKTISNESIFGKAIIFAPGTFLNGKMFTGKSTINGGRFNEQPSLLISEKLQNLGFEAGRLKTGTPPRIHSNSIDYSKLQISPGETPPIPFSFKTKEVKNSILCWQTETNEKTHDILKEGFDESPMFTGRIEGVGPRYCPSIEDKINRFSDRNSHKIVLEPEGLDTDSVYVNGFSTSLPASVQQKGINTIPGLEKAKIFQYGYAIEYDFFFPYQLQFTLETKLIENLYFAGQINGTSGYEEAAVQGIMAAINAVNKIRSEKPFLLNRSEAYTGVLIDDLVNKSTEEPYRIFTSLAEYRLLLRQDNADIRLMKYGYQFGLIPENVFNTVSQNRNLTERCFDLAKDIRLQAQLVNPYLESIGESSIIEPSDLKSLARRPKASIQKLISLLDNRPLELNQILENQKALEQLGYEIKYEGYIERQRKEIERYLHNEKKYIPKDFDYSNVKGISNEAREKLIKIRPNSLGQASRISGVSSSDVSVLSIYLR